MTAEVERLVEEFHRTSRILGRLTLKPCTDAEYDLAFDNVLRAKAALLAAFKALQDENERLKANPDEVLKCVLKSLKDHNAELEADLALWQNGALAELSAKLEQENESLKRQLQQTEESSANAYEKWQQLEQSVKAKDAEIERLKAVAQSRMDGWSGDLIKCNAELTQLEQKNADLRDPLNALALITHAIGERLPEKTIGELRAMTLAEIYGQLKAAIGD